MRRALLALIALGIAACTTPLEVGERLYREGDTLGALEVWRAALEEDSDQPAIQARLTDAEEEFDQLVRRYKKNASYFEAKGRLAESILNYRLALKLQPDDAPALAHVQDLARALATRKEELEATYRVDFGAKELADARLLLDQLRTLDPFDPELEGEERRLQAALRAEVEDRLAAGRQALAAGNHDAARRAFQAVLALEPGNEPAREHLSYIAIRESQASGEEPARVEAPGAVDSEDEFTAQQGFYRNGLLAERNGELFTAIEQYQRALDADPGHLAARRRQAAIRQQLAGEVEALIERGREQFREEDLLPARDSWRRALLIDPDNERAKAYLERAERQLDNLERLRSEPDVAGGRD